MGGLALRSADAPAAAYTAFQHRAWYIYLISQYTQWPTNTFADPSAPFVLGILGKDPFGRDLDLIKDKPIKQRALKVLRFKEAADITTCHALYVADSDPERVRAILTALAGRPILTFGETAPFRRHQGIVTLWEQPETRDKAYLYFDINRAAARQAGLRISAYVLKLARPDPHAASPP
ncbi:MAG: YfiR family protein [Verrucomicrobia bacterium]|nr:YfiR family protein [Verrucomicrobiota bacterium]